MPATDEPSVPISQEFGTSMSDSSVEPPRILIVDDEPNVRRVFRLALESAGYSVKEAGDGIEALEATRSERFSLMLLDLRMPGLDGFDTLRRLRAERLDVPVIMITAHGGIPDAVEAMKLGAIDFVSKPVTPQMLRDAVRELLKRHAPGADDAEASLSHAKREINRGQFDSAATLLDRIHSLDEVSLAEAHYLRGLMLEMRGKVEEAQSAYRASLAADPTFAPALAQLGACENDNPAS